MTEANIRAVLIGGTYDGWKVMLSRTPERISIGQAGEAREIYERVDDPDTGEFLGGYVRPDPSSHVWTVGGGTAYGLGRAEKHG